MRKLNLKQMFLAEIFKINNQKASVLILAILILGVLLFVSSYFISFTFTGSKMAESQVEGLKAYYLAEAGVQEAIFKLKNDSIWINAFETLPTPEAPNCSSWLITSYTRESALFENGSYTINITNLGCAKAEITSQAKIQISDNKIAQRIVKVKVFKALGNPVSDFNIFTGGASENITIKSTNPLNVHNGSIFSNNKIKVEFWSEVNVDNKMLAHNKIDVSSWPFPSQLNATSCASNVCDIGCEIDECPLQEQISMPRLDINSDDPGSYFSQSKSDDCSFVRSDGKTNCVFTPEEFESLMWQHYPDLSFPGEIVIYVSGDINIRAGQKLIVNGVLSAGRDINIGEDYCWTRSEFPFIRCGSSQVIVQRPGAPQDNKASGILAVRKIDTGNWLGFGVKVLDVEGLIYAGDEFRLSGVEGPIEIHGGIAVRKLTTSSMWHGIDIYLDQDIIIDTFKNPVYSPVITIDHWEEEY